MSLLKIINMKNLILAALLLLPISQSIAQILENPSLETSQMIGFGVTPESWTSWGLHNGLTDLDDKDFGDNLINPISNLFPEADSTDKFWYFWSNTDPSNFGGITQQLNSLEPNTEYCFSFKAGVSRYWANSSSIRLELYFDGLVSDGETFYFPNDSESKEINLCFTSGEETTSGEMGIRTNFLDGFSTHIFIQAGSGSFTKTINTATVELFEKLKIFPNPTSDILHIDFLKNSAETSIKIHTTDGKCMINKKFKNENNIVLDLANLNPGIYFLILTSEMKSTVQKIVIEN